MLKVDVTTVEGRRKLITRTIHESHLEGHEVTPDLRALYEQFIDGKMTMEQVKTVYFKGIKAVA